MKTLDVTRCRPLGNRIVVAREPLPERHSSGLYVLGREWPACGTVLAIGQVKHTGRWCSVCHGKRVGHLFASSHTFFPLERTQALDGALAIGDRVYFDRFAHENREIPGEPGHFVIDADKCLVRFRSAN